MEALLAGALDLTYVGPSPAINVFVRSQGDAIRIVAGAANGGAVLVVRKGAGITKPEDFRGKKVAAPELGNTQDVALRHWLKSYGLRPKAQGGDVDVLAVKNPDILALFARGALDAAWVPEPWATRLLHEADGELFVDEKTLWPDGAFPTVVLVARTKFLREHRDVVERFVRAHEELTGWIQTNPQDAQRAINAGLETWVGQPLPEQVLSEAFGRIQFVIDPATKAMSVSATRAWELGYLPGDEPPDVTGLFELIEVKNPDGSSLPPAAPLSAR
jgi:NitT/TauT family transport system substrate-binding protein